MNPDFLTLYNEELRYLREAGDAFAKQNPQVAQYLGFHRDGTQDPFVERLLEGSAFLTSRVHERLNQEQAEVAQNMLTHLAPGWSAPVPSITTLALKPDMAYPQWGAVTCLPGGSRVLLKDPSLGDQPATFITAHDVNIQPVEIAHAAMLRHPPASLPTLTVKEFREAESCLHLKLSTRGIMPLKDLNFSPLRLTIGSELVVMHRLLTLMLTSTLRIVLHAQTRNGPMVAVLPASSIYLAGLNDENLLPQAIGELPGMRLLREYFAAPGRFATVRIEGLGPFLSQGDHCHEFDLFFLFDRPSEGLINRLKAEDFHLHAVVALNLYARSCSPVNLNHNHTEYPLVVDRLNANRYCLHSLVTVNARLDNQEKIALLSPIGHTLASTQTRPAYWALHRRYCPQTNTNPHSNLPEEQTFLSFSTGHGGIAPERLRTLLVEAMVCERHLNPDRLQQPSWVLEQSMPISAITTVRHPSRPQPVPPAEMNWLALQFLNVNPLHYCLPDVKDCSELLRRWLLLFTDARSSAQRKQVGSIRRASISHHFERWDGKGPLCWTRGSTLSLDLANHDHADEGGMLFGWIVWHALSDYGELNYRLNLELKLDGEFLTAQEAAHG
ncbi:type VI secretion system baseplate subunit TssF (plasmid) [Pantoea dispersa]|uniref:type VI secretion system baseplate subunit TssF n=1 Tax=Pantoea dispersa TaxID=59814 RepID=UPI001CA6F3BC|nr:type VI secretion system baseplate subunit TssF [Pantoea dispersa]QZY93066.1 type VI secretion system baseplate subunit TssF [Pantoea dispersa]